MVPSRLATARAAGYKRESLLSIRPGLWCRESGSRERAGILSRLAPVNTYCDIGQVADIEDEFRRSVKRPNCIAISPLTASESTWHSSRGTVEMIATRDNPVERPPASRADAGEWLLR